MYLKRQCKGDACRYILCESYQEKGTWKHRSLLDLGTNPEAYIEYPGGNSFYIKESLERALREKRATFSPDDLEDLLMPFLDPRIRRIVESFQRPGKPRSPWKDYSEDQLLQRQKALHPFDKRRLHYLRFGRVDIGNLAGRSWKFLNVLLEKSRDEIEQIIEGMEYGLPPHELRPYMYTALELQTHFRHLLTRNQPSALDPRKLDDYFLEDLCKLNRDERFFLGVDEHDPDRLHPYLIKYLILYFDHAFDPRMVWDEYVQDFVRRHRFYQRPGEKSGLSETEKAACIRLGITHEAFGKMDRRELVKCFRRRAKETHPDKGGDKEAFLKIKEAYECLLRRKY